MMISNLVVLNCVTQCSSYEGLCIWQFYGRRVSVLVLLLAALVVLWVVKTVYAYNTTFSKDITVASKEVTGARGKREYIVVDSESTWYEVRGMPHQIGFDRSALWAGLEVGQSYRVHGYGTRVSLLGIHPILTSVE